MLLSFDCIYLVRSKLEAAKLDEVGKKKLDEVGKKSC